MAPRPGPVTYREFPLLNFLQSNVWLPVQAAPMRNTKRHAHDNRAWGKVIRPEESQSECPPSPEYMLPDHWEAPGSGVPDQPEEPASQKEQRNEKPYDGSGMVAGADSTSDTALADVKSEVISEDASLASKNMFEFLALGKSTAKGVPVGVFTLKALPKGLHFGPYQGVKVDCIENGGCTWP
ncbi:hypothetical protein V5799_004701, partial [Amblyomma americanum]